MNPLWELDKTLFEIELGTVKMNDSDFWAYVNLVEMPEQKWIIESTVDDIISDLSNNTKNACSILSELKKIYYQLNSTLDLIVEVYNSFEPEQYDSISVSGLVKAIEDKGFLVKHNIKNLRYCSFVGNFNFKLLSEIKFRSNQVNGLILHAESFCDEHQHSNKKYEFSVREWSTILYYAECAKYIDRELPFEERYKIICKIKKVGTKNSFKDRYHDSIRRIKKLDYQVEKLEKIIPYIKEHFPKAKGFVLNDIEAIETEKREREK
jgi:hypothetical protein